MTKIGRMTDWRINKETLIRTRNWSGLYAFEEYKYYTENNLKQQLGEKNKSNGIYNTYHSPLSQEWVDGRY